MTIISIGISMNTSIQIILFCFCNLLFFNSAAAELEKEVKPNQTEQQVLFKPPSGWKQAEQSALPAHVHLMVVGKGARDFPPSISLASETYSGSLKQYLNVIKKLNAAKGNEWKDLGSIQTEAGKASLSQTDSSSQWGKVKMMHVILKKEDTIYILTAAALKEEFPQFYKEIFSSLRSLKLPKQA
jgi:hypothetical protein